jgi:hypothetical protein
MTAKIDPMKILTGHDGAACVRMIHLVEALRIKDEAVRQAIFDRLDDDDDGVRQAAAYFVKHCLPVKGLMKYVRTAEQVLEARHAELAQAIGYPSIDSLIELWKQTSGTRSIAALVQVVENDKDTAAALRVLRSPDEFEDEVYHAALKKLLGDWTALRVLQGLPFDRRAKLVDLSFQHTLKFWEPLEREKFPEFSDAWKLVVGSDSRRIFAFVVALLNTLQRVVGNRPGYLERFMFRFAPAERPRLLAAMATSLVGRFEKDPGVRLLRDQFLAIDDGLRWYARRHLAEFDKPGKVRKGTITMDELLPREAPTF